MNEINEALSNVVGARVRRSLIRVAGWSFLTGLLTGVILMAMGR